MPRSTSTYSTRASYLLTSRPRADMATFGQVVRSATITNGQPAHAEHARGGCRTACPGLVHPRELHRLVRVRAAPPPPRVSYI